MPTYQEYFLRIFKRQRQGAEGLVGIAQGRSGTSLAHVRHDRDGAPALLGCHWLAAVGDSLQPGLAQLVKEQNLFGAQCVAVLAADEYQLMQVEMAELPADEKLDAARWQIREMLNYPADQAIVDLFEVAPYTTDKRPLTYAVAAQKKRLLARVDQLTAADFKIAAIDIAEFALRNVTDLFAEESRGVAILLLQESEGLLVIAREGTLYLTRSFPIGMNALLPYADGDVEALTEQVDSIVLEIQRSFDYCESTFHLPVVSRLLVAQTQREIPAVIRYLDDVLAPQVESLRFDDVLKVPDESDQLELNRHLLAIGGALRQVSV